MSENSLPLVIANETVHYTPLYLVKSQDEAVLSELCGAYGAFLRSQGFKGKEGDFTLLPNDQGSVIGAVFCVPEKKGPLPYGALATLLPEGVWRLENRTGSEQFLNEAVLGFCLGRYHYRLGQKETSQSVKLCVPEAVDPQVVNLAKAAWLGRDLINTPANLLGPQELAHRAQQELESRGATVEVIRGDSLTQNYPCLAAVGAGSDRSSAVVVARWKAREGARRLSLVGKGVCFDTGGYDLKPSASMLKMKKDMGGAALMLSLTCALIDAKSDVDIELRLGCVENSVSGHAMRPGDVLPTRKGLYVEIGNTDAEGRLVLCDLLAEASESKPDILLDAATLTGAARVALGPDLPALFSNDDELADSLIKASEKAHDPLWRLPLWPDYDAWLESPIADCNNVSSRPMAGAITAALYLQRFIPEKQKWAHIDTYGWNDVGKMGRPAGGETLMLRGLFEAFK
ncbi:leucyl aminopeptidase family protein [Saccharibacter sp. 17.LH.SD]|uniref:leucyl aminopeptidase family protein n=1 Tax=Saccharibacter sp. 17.LH.SD TaxID=2689393 RepID=UPI001368A1E7|nr:leucyl aminopeptidase family protein [Saccharibacter sp. 17.LH.SD]MXV44176.1 leucyl aminopeptidase family protein [Saccharibacter sp. 17.LH.SD]